MDIGFVYRWTNTSNYKWYIGSHRGSITDSYIGSGKAFLASYKKNPSFFVREILYVGPDFRELEGFILEELNAAEDRSSYNLKNSSIGGDTSMHFTEESRRKMSEASKIHSKGRKLSQESRDKISKKLKETYALMGRKRKPKVRKERKTNMEAMKRLHNNNKKKVYYEKENITFDSIGDLCLFLGKSNSYISNVLAGRCKNIYGIYKV
jgi:SpoVK/Ycf46/Vps4 family AAA+-type ATPase